MELCEFGECYWKWSRNQTIVSFQNHKVVKVVNDFGILVYLQVVESCIPDKKEWPCKRRRKKKNLQILCSEVQEKKFTIFCVQKSKKRNKITVFVVFRKWQIIVCAQKKKFFL